LQGVWDRGTSKKIWTPYLFLQPLKVATSNLVHNLGLGLAYQKTTFWTKIGGGLGQGSIQTKFGTPYIFLQPLKVATSNLVHNLDLGLAYQKQRFGPKLAGSGPREHPNKIWDPLHISATIEANNFKCGTQIGFGTSLAKTTFKTKIGGGLGNIQKKLGPLLISATVEASNFKFGIQLEFGASLPKKNNV